MKIYYFLILIAFAHQACTAQKEPWSKTKNWRVYAIDGPAVFTYPVDSLKMARGHLLNQDSVQFYLKQMQPVPEDRRPTWMGAFLGSYETSGGVVKKVEIGVYGGYFYDVEADKYYSLPRQLIRPWQKFIVGNVPES